MLTFFPNTGGVANIDEIDIDLLVHSWNPDRPGYLRRKYKGKTEYLHAIIGKRLNLSGPLIDHKDGNKFNCCRNNLRSATKSQNNANSRVRSRHGYKGVYLRKDKWMADITVNGIVNHLGTYRSIVDAAKAYDRAAKQAFGEYARLNFPEDDNVSTVHDHRQRDPQSSSL